MSQHNSIPAIHNELRSEYGKYIAAKSNKGFFRLIIKVVIIPLVALSVMLAGAAVFVANFAPARYTQAKDIIFSKIDFERLTGQSNSVNKELLDRLLILNSPKQQLDEQATQEKLQQDQTPNQPQ